MGDEPNGNFLLPVLYERVFRLPTFGSAREEVPLGQAPSREGNSSLTRFMETREMHRKGYLEDVTRVTV